MENYHLKFVKPLTSIALVAALLSNTSTLFPATTAVAKSSDLKVSKGRLISKSTKKLKKGIVTYKGKLYKDGKLLTGIYKTILYLSGKKATSWYGTGKNRKWYENGRLLTGFGKNTGRLFISGKVAVATWYGIGKNRKWYEKGRPLTGIKTSSNQLFVNGKINSGLYLFQKKLYNGPSLNKQSILYKNKLYNGYSLNKGRTLYKGKLYNGSLANKGLVIYQGRLYNGTETNKGLIFYKGTLYNDSAPNKGLILFKDKLYNGPSENKALILYKDKLYYGSQLNKGFILFNGALYNGETLNEGIMYVGGKWYNGSTLASGTITTPDGRTITVTDGEETTSNSGGSWNPPPVKVDTPPIASNVTITGTVKEGQTLTVSYDYQDAENDEDHGTTIQWYANGTAIQGATNKTYQLTVSEIGKTITVKVTPKNAKGEGQTVTSSPTTPAVAANQPPTIIEPDPSIIILERSGAGVNINLTDYFNDPDEDSLQYTFSSTNTNISGIINGSSISLSGGPNISTDNITITANDGKGGISSLTIPVNVVDTVAPVFMPSLPSVTNTTTDQISATSILNEKGTIYYVAVPNADINTPPSVQQIIDGKDGNGQEAAWKGQWSVNEGFTPQVFTIPNLNPATLYTIYMAAKDQYNNVQAQTISIQGTTLSTPKLVSKTITNLDFATINGTQAQATSKTMTTSNFGDSPKQFSISNGQVTIPINLYWNIPTFNGEQTFTIAQVVASAIDSTIQDYCNANGISLMERPFGAFGFSDTFYLTAFKTGDQITLSGPDWNYFFEQPTYTSTPTDYSKNRMFTVSDGTNTATIQLTRKFNSMANLVTYLNSQLQTANVAITAVANGDTFELKANTTQGKVTVTGTNATDFFSTLTTEQPQP